MRRSGGDDLRVRLAGAIRRERARRGLTQEALAERSGLNPRHLQKLEKGEVNATLDTLAALAAALGLDPTHLLQR